MKKILYIVKNIDGGTGYYIESLQLLSSKYTTRTLVLEKPSFRKPLKNYEFISSFQHISDSGYFDFISHLIRFIRILQRINRYIKITQPDIILGVDAYVNILIILQKIIFRSKHWIVITTHNYLDIVISKKSQWPLSRIIKITIHFLYVYADRVVAVSEGVKNDLKNTFGIQKEVSTIYNGMKQETEDQIHGVKPKKGMMVSAGRLVEQKDFDTLIRAFQIAQKTVPKIHLGIIGDGPLNKHLHELARKLRINDKITFFGWVQRTEYVLRQADFFIHSTKWEGFPYVILEAMKCGLPIIATRSPHGIVELLGNGKYGRLIPMGDVQGMAEQMVRFSKNIVVRKQYGSKSLKRYASFPIETMLKKYDALFSSFYHK